jgi:hypothetical protein
MATPGQNMASVLFTVSVYVLHHLHCLANIHDDDYDDLDYMLALYVTALSLMRLEITTVQQLDIASSACNCPDAFFIIDA